MSSVDPPRPGRARAFALRFALVYWGLFCGLLHATTFYGLDRLGAPLVRAWDALVVWVGVHVLGIAYEIRTDYTGSGDKTADWVSLLCIACLATVAAAAWTALDRRRRHDTAIREVLRVTLRYALAFEILFYGIDKLFLGQFPPPGLGRLGEKIGDASPMGLMWTFMGASPAYVFFSGLAETVGATLLLFRRTTTLGALVLAAVLTNIVLMNFCYDVPVKINSTHYLVMCVVLLAPDLRRLADVLVFDRATVPARREIVLPKRWMRRARAILKYGVIALVVIPTVREARRGSGDEVHTWYSGYWKVTAFARDGRDVPAIVDDASRWQRVKFEAGEKIYVRWRNMDDSYGDLYEVAIDEAHGTMSWTPSPDDKPTHPTGPIALRYAHPDADHLQLDGAIAGVPVSVRLQRIVPTDSLLVSRGFHWISEEPFNE